MAILSVDLAFRRWSDLGIVILSRENFREKSRTVSCEIVPLADPEMELNGPDVAGKRWHDRRSHRHAAVDPNILAGRLNHLCASRSIRIILLDGPQAWKSRENGIEHSRVNERMLNCAAKTGLPGMVKPATYRPFAEFCMDVYDGLCRRGWRRLESLGKPTSPPDRVLVESYPHAAWKSLGLKPLPSKRRALVSDLAEAYAALNALVPFTTNRPPNHDQLQAIVGGLPGLDLEENNPAAIRIVGTPPRREDSHWREGFIVLPVTSPASDKIRWLH